jgi:hypothetical protein
MTPCSVPVHGLSARRVASAPPRPPRAKANQALALVVVVMACCCAVAAAGASGPISQVKTIAASAIATRVDQAPRLDGTLGDPLWQQAVPLTGFHQREPHEGEPPSERTEVRILYTREAVYFGVRCLDSEPGGIVASELRRDASQELDDYFEIIIDPDHDRRNAHVFQVNPLGTQRDALITEEHRSSDGDGEPGWDGIWISEARVQADGWTATIMIPFATLNVRHSDTPVWGLNFKRFIRRKNEEMLWTSWLRVEGANRVSRAGELQGLSDVGGGRVVVIKPYVLGSYDSLSQQATQAGLEPGASAQLTGGVDARVGLGSSMVANFTINTDFADADVDINQFNLTPYRLFYPEKRAFFLENTGIFSFPLGASNDNLFFSRNIGIDSYTGQEVPINAGAKITGAAGDYQLGLLAVGTRNEGTNPEASFGIARVKRALGGGSYIGAIAMAKRSGEYEDRYNSYNQIEGIDTRWVVMPNLRIRGFLAQSRTPGYSSGQSAWGALLYYEDNRAELLWDHRYYGANFNPEVGFLELPDCICDFASLNLKARPQVLNLRQVSFENSVQRALFTSGVLQNGQVMSTFRAELDNGAYTDVDLIAAITQRLTEPFNIYKNVFIPVGEYRYLRHQIAVGSPKDRQLIVAFRERFGDYYDGKLNSTYVSASYRVSPRLLLSVAQEWDRFLLPEPGGHFTVSIGNLQANYSFSRFLSASALLQVDSAYDRPAGANLRLRWTYRPDSDLYFIYTSGTHLANVVDDNPSQYFERKFVLKWTYSWVP